MALFENSLNLSSALPSPLASVKEVDLRMFNDFLSLMGVPVSWVIKNHYHLN